MPVNCDWHSSAQKYELLCGSIMHSTNWGTEWRKKGKYKREEKASLHA